MSEDKEKNVEKEPQQENVEVEKKTSEQAVSGDNNQENETKKVSTEEVLPQKDVAKKASPEIKKKRWAGRPPARKQDDSGFIEKVISINRITKVTKGGKKLSFSALVVVGDGKGQFGYCLDKAPEVATAIQKSLRIAKKKMVSIPLRKGTISHEIIGRCGGATVLLKPAFEGTGVIAAGPVRAICDAVGIHNILTKCHRSNNPINVIKATADGLLRLKPFKEIGE